MNCVILSSFSPLDELNCMEQHFLLDLHFSDPYAIMHHCEDNVVCFCLTGHDLFYHRCKIVTLYVCILNQLTLGTQQSSIVKINNKLAASISHGWLIETWNGCGDIRPLGYLRP